MDKIFRTPYKCTVCGHLNFEKFTLIQGEIRHRGWILKKCDCLRYTVPEGYKAFSTDDMYIMKDDNGVEAFENDTIEREWHGKTYTGPLIFSIQGIVVKIDEKNYLPIGLNFKITGNVYNNVDKQD